MSLDLIDLLISNWKDPNYTGLNCYHNSINNRITLMRNKTCKDIKEMKFIKPNYVNMSDYEATANGLTSFHQDYNFTVDGKFSYNIRDDYINVEILSKYLKLNTKNVLEIGFNVGLISTIILSEIDAEITSIDYFQNICSWYAKAFIDEKFPLRHMLLTGLADEMINLIEFGQPLPFKYDLVIINEDISYDSIIKIKEYSHENTIIIFNKICPHQSYGLQPYLLMKKLVLEGILIFEEYIKIDKNYINGIAVLKYNFNNSLNKNIFNNKICKEIESNIPLKELHEFILNRQEDQFADNSIIKTYIHKLMAEGLRIDKELIKLIKEKFNINI